ncbi:MAG: hypothetical protein ABI885_17265 [Gammaproteobacteria bacterium]
MRQLKLAKRQAGPSWWALVFLAVCCALSLVVTFRASAQSPPPAPAAAKSPAPASAPSSSSRTSKPEESATIPDDPTLVPDDKESADNNVSFPIDI